MKNIKEVLLLHGIADWEKFVLIFIFFPSVGLIVLTLENLYIIGQAIFALIYWTKLYNRITSIKTYFNNLNIRK